MAKLDSGAMTIGNNDNWREIFDDQNATAVAANQATADLAPIINGKRCALSVASGGFVLLRNSTITGKADGAYTAAKAIPANTDLDGSYLTAISGGVANALNGKISGFGEIIIGNKNSDTVAVANNTGTLISTIVLTSGVWVVVGCADWASNENGYRQIAFNGDSINPSRNAAVTMHGINGKEAYQQITYIRATTGETISMYARQTSGGNLNVYPYLYAVKVGLY